MQPIWTKRPTSHFWLDDPSLLELHDKKLGFNTRINGPCLDKYRDTMSVSFIGPIGLHYMAQELMGQSSTQAHAPMNQVGC